MGKHKRAARTLLALAVAGALPQHGARAQQAGTQAEAGQLETVIVTAQRRAENIKDVPMAISTLKGEKLDVLTAGGQDIRFLSGRAPSLTVESDYGRSFPRFYIRGQGNTDFDLNASQPVGLVVDDIVQESPLLKGFPVFDVDQVEVLRGPQGTLFGRNAPAGVVKYDSVRPVFRTEGYGSVGIGNFGARNAEGAYNVALGDTVALRLSLQSQHRDDRVHNPRPNAPTRDFEGYHDNAARLQVLVQPRREFSALFNLHGRTMNGSATLFRANQIKPGSAELIDGFDYGSYPTDGANRQHLHTSGANARLRWELDGLTLHAISGYETADFYSRGDVDGGYGAAGMAQTGPGAIAFSLETADLLPAHHQFSQELRVESNGKQALQWTAGLFYFKEGLQIDSIGFDSFAPGNPQRAAYSQQNQDARSWAGFGSLNYAASERLKLRGGLRYTSDSKQFAARRVDGVTAGPFRVERDSSNVSWDMSGTYALDAGSNLFARVATGYRAPSIQGRLFGLSDRPSVANAEKVLSYEGGIKQELFGQRARLSASLFQYRVRDKQLTAGSGAINQNQLINADKVTGQGVELDFQALLSDSLRLTVGGSYNDTQIRDARLFIMNCGGPCTPTNPAGPAPGTALIDGNPLPRAPQWQGNLTLRYSAPLADGEFYAYTDWAYRGSYNMFLYEAKEYKAKSLLEGGLRLGYKWSNYELAVFARNLTNRMQLVGAIDINNLAAITSEPRTVGLQLRAGF